MERGISKAIIAFVGAVILGGLVFMVVRARNQPTVVVTGRVECLYPMRSTTQTQVRLDTGELIVLDGVWGQPGQTVEVRVPASRLTGRR